MSIEETIQEQIDSNSILLYMKGNPEQPQCGFSAQTTQVLNASPMWTFSATQKLDPHCPRFLTGPLSRNYLLMVN